MAMRALNIVIFGSFVIAGGKHSHRSNGRTETLTAQSPTTSQDFEMILLDCDDNNCYLLIRSCPWCFASSVGSIDCARLGLQGPVSEEEMDS